MQGSGRGGRNVEFLLSLAVAFDGLPGVFALAADTDGVDGAGEVAGAVVAPDTLLRAAGRGIGAKARLADNDGHGFFEALATWSSPARPSPTSTTSAPFSSSQHQERAAVQAAT